MLDAGADLLQLYTGFIYRGPGLVADLNAAIAASDRPARDVVDGVMIDLYRDHRRHRLAGRGRR